MHHQKPIVIAHRGASGYYPEHTALAYEQAIDMGADFVEPDLVFTADGHLICRHDRFLGTTTNIADHPEFADRKATKPGHPDPDWYAEDFTLAEIKTLRCRQLWPSRSADYDDLHDILTFEELLTLINKHAHTIDRPIGVCPELKHPAVLLDLGHDFLPSALDLLAQHGFGSKQRPVFFQSFDPAVLKRAKQQSSLPLVQLIRNEDLMRGGMRPSSIAEDAYEYASVIAPHKSLVFDNDGNDTGFVKRCHDMGKLVHVWAFVDELVGPSFATMEEEIQAHLKLGVDGVFSDFPDRAKKIRDEQL